jgi:hypothetical protein
METTNTAINTSIPQTPTAMKIIKLPIIDNAIFAKYDAILNNYSKTTPLLYCEFAIEADVIFDKVEIDFAKHYVTFIGHHESSGKCYSTTRDVSGNYHGND